jgi:hypothetical protein
MLVNLGKKNYVGSNEENLKRVKNSLLWIFVASTNRKRKIIIT